MTLDLHPIYLSIKTALIAVTIISAIAIPLSRYMARNEFPGKDFIESLITLPLVLPPSVIGFALLMLFGKYSPLGQFLENWFGFRVVFTWWGAVVASATVSFPLMYQAMKAAFEGVDLNLEKVARTLGATELKIFFTITIPLAWPGMMTGFVLAFARALGEFGATLMLAGNIPGLTQTIPLAIYFATETGDTTTAWKLVALMTIFSFTLIFWLNKWTKSHKKYLRENK